MRTRMSSGEHVLVVQEGAAAFTSSTETTIPLGAFSVLVRNVTSAASENSHLLLVAVSAHSA